MRKLVLIMIIVAISVSMHVGVTNAYVEATEFDPCAYALYSPSYAMWCFYETMMDAWDPLDWGD